MDLGSYNSSIIVVYVWTLWPTNLATRNLALGFAFIPASVGASGPRRHVVGAGFRVSGFRVSGVGFRV